MTSDYGTCARCQQPITVPVAMGGRTSALTHARESECIATLRAKIAEVEAENERLLEAVLHEGNKVANKAADRLTDLTRERDEAREKAKNQAREIRTMQEVAERKNAIINELRGGPAERLPEGVTYAVMRKDILRLTKQREAVVEAARNLLHAEANGTKHDHRDARAELRAALAEIEEPKTIGTDGDYPTVEEWEQDTEPALEMECRDGGKCWHGCTENGAGCWREQNCGHFSDYTGPWGEA